MSVKSRTGLYPYPEGIVSPPDADGNCKAHCSLCKQPLRVLLADEPEVALAYHYCGTDKFPYLILLSRPAKLTQAERILQRYKD